MEVRLKVTEGERVLLTEYFDAVEAARAILNQASNELTVAVRVVLTRFKEVEKKRVTVDSLVDDELVLTMPDLPKELQDGDRAAESPRVGPNSEQGAE